MRRSRKKDGKFVMVPIGEGDIDHRRAVQLLKDSNYSGFLSGEWINWEPYEIHLPRELLIMKVLDAAQESHKKGRIIKP